MKTMDELKIKRIADSISSDTDMIAVIGPTASGKTSFAVKLAKELKMRGTEAEIISADSRQVYRGMDIGTGKDLSEYTGAGVCYHLIDIADAGEKYNLFRYSKDFREVYADLKRRSVYPVLCGGSGLYVEAVTRGYSLPEVPPDPELRKSLEGKSLGELTDILSGMKSLHNTTDVDSCKRAVRAIEIAEYCRKHEEVAALACEGLPSSVRFIGISVDRDERNRRIDARLDARLEEGMVEEVKSLLESGISAEDLIYYGLEYKFVTLYLTGELSYSRMKEKLAIAIHQFAKRQMTWFRGMERRGIEIEWV